MRRIPSLFSATSAENGTCDQTSSKYAKLTTTSQDTASRDLTDLVTKKVLKKGKAGGRSTHFVLV